MRHWLISANRQAEELDAILKLGGIIGDYGAGPRHADPALGIVGALKGGIDSAESAIRGVNSRSGLASYLEAPGCRMSNIEGSRHEWRANRSLGVRCDTGGNERSNTPSNIHLTDLTGWEDSQNGVVLAIADDAEAVARAGLPPGNVAYLDNRSVGGISWCRLPLQTVSASFYSGQIYARGSGQVRLGMLGASAGPFVELTDDYQLVDRLMETATQGNVLEVAVTAGGWVQFKLWSVEESWSTNAVIWRDPSLAETSREADGVSWPMGRLTGYQNSAFDGMWDPGWWDVLEGAVVNRGQIDFTAGGLTEAFKVGIFTLDWWSVNFRIENLPPNGYAQVEINNEVFNIAREGLWNYTNLINGAPHLQFRAPVNNYTLTDLSIRPARPVWQQSEGMAAIIFRLPQGIDRMEPATNQFLLAPHKSFVNSAFFRIDNNPTGTFAALVIKDDSANFNGVAFGPWVPGGRYLAIARWSDVTQMALKLQGDEWSDGSALAYSGAFLFDNNLGVANDCEIPVWIESCYLWNVDRGMEWLKKRFIGVND